VRASIVIPAHNEASVIQRCLHRMLAGAEPDEFDVLVVCNGCTDDTAKLAATVPGVRVIEVSTPSKVAALNAGDAAAKGFPRIYLDADVLLDTASLRAVADALAAGAPAAAPSPIVDTTGCGFGSRRYFAMWSQLGYVRHSMIGSGVYGLSEAGRARFGEFPELIADDGYVYSHFSADERINPAGASFTVRAPRGLREVLRRRIRIVAGNKQLLARTGRRMQVPDPNWRQVLIRKPWLLPSAAIFLPVNLIAERRAQATLNAAGTVGWNRDESSRGEPRMPGSSKGRRVVAALGSQGSWKQLAMVVNFFGYDGSQRRRMRLGPGVRLSPTVSVRNGERISIGAGAHVGQWSCLWAGDHTGRIEIGDHALLAPDVFITASDYDFDAGDGPVMDLPKREADIHIGARTWLGAKVIVVAGVSIGDGTIVAAGAVVTKDLPANCVAGGVPAKVIRQRGRAIEA
jgi:hypothetical protein